jgi:CxxC-x17-CxxC domain-containing protein
MVYQDMELVCSDCGNAFVFSVTDQEYYASKGFQTPKRCLNCREQRKASSGHNRQQRELYTTTCSRCGKEAQVPFVPRMDRPVYCSECYEPAPRAF